MKTAALLRASAMFVLATLLTACNRGDHPTQIAAPAPDFTIRDGKQTIRLSQFRGKLVVLNFWATWCPPCIQELPSLQELQRLRPDVQVLTVSIDDDADAYKKFLDRYNVNLLSIRSGMDGANLKYGSTRPPETFIIDRNGAIQRKFIGPVDWTNPEIIGYLAKL